MKHNKKLDTLNIQAAEKGNTTEHTLSYCNRFDTTNNRIVAALTRPAGARHQERVLL
jgi:hypothetical protein